MLGLNCTNLTDDELLNRIANARDLSPLELVLATRLQRARDEIALLEREYAAEQAARREAEARREAYQQGRSPLLLVDAMRLRRGA